MRWEKNGKGWGGKTKMKEGIRKGEGERDTEGGEENEWMKEGARGEEGRKEEPRFPRRSWSYNPLSSLYFPPPPSLQSSVSRSARLSVLQEISRPSDGGIMMMEGEETEEREGGRTTWEQDPLSLSLALALCYSLWINGISFPTETLTFEISLPLSYTPSLPPFIFIHTSFPLCVRVQLNKLCMNKGKEKKKSARRRSRGSGELGKGIK